MRRICGRGSASLVTFIAIACISLIPEESWILCSQHTTQEPPLHIFALEIEASSAWISQSSTRLLLYFPVPANNSGIKWRAPPTEGSKTARSDLEVAGGAAPEIKIRPLIGGGGCGSSVSGEILSWSVRVAVDGQVRLHVHDVHRRGRFTLAVRAAMRMLRVRLPVVRIRDARRLNIFVGTCAGCRIVLRVLV
jgi:hypothetical protein